MIKKKKHRRFGCKLQEKLYAKERKLQLLNEAHKRCIAVRDIQIIKQKDLLLTVSMINECLLKHLNVSKIEFSRKELLDTYNDYYLDAALKDDSIELRFAKKDTAEKEPAADTAEKEPAADTAEKEPASNTVETKPAAD